MAIWCEKTGMSGANIVLYAEEWSNFKVISWNTITDNTGIKLTDLLRSPTFEKIPGVLDFLNQLAYFNTLKFSTSTSNVNTSY